MRSETALSQTQNPNKMKIRENVTFYTIQNGHSTWFGNGKEVCLGNGNVYAIITHSPSGFSYVRTYKVYTYYEGTAQYFIPIKTEYIGKYIIDNSDNNTCPLFNSPITDY